MPTGHFDHLPLYDPASAALRTRVIARLRALSANGYAPTRDEWTAGKPDGYPGQEWISKTPGWGWPALIIEAGLRPRTPHNSRVLKDPMQAPLTECERHTCALRGRQERGW